MPKTAVPHRVSAVFISVGEGIRADINAVRVSAARWLIRIPYFLSYEASVLFRILLLTMNSAECIIA